MVPRDEEHAFKEVEGLPRISQELYDPKHVRILYEAYLEYAAVTKARCESERQAKRDEEGKRQADRAAARAARKEISGQRRDRKLARQAAKRRCELST